MADQWHSGKTAEQMTAVFSASTWAMGGVRIAGWQVLAEQALGELPFRRKQVRGLEVGVHTHITDGKTVILDTVAGLRVVGDDFPAAAASVDVRLVEDGVPVLGRTNEALLEQGLCCVFVKEFGKEIDKYINMSKAK